MCHLTKKFSTHIPGETTQMWVVFTLPRPPMSGQPKHYLQSWLGWGAVVSLAALVYTYRSKTTDKGRTQR